jgi:hypothetical protein
VDVILEEDRAPPLEDFDMFDWTAFDRFVESRYRPTMALVDWEPGLVEAPCSGGTP